MSLTREDHLPIGLASTVKGIRMGIFVEFGHTYPAALDLPSRLESIMRQEGNAFQVSSPALRMLLLKHEQMMIVTSPNHLSSGFAAKLGL